MIPMLLWRCPLCATNDALLHIERRFRADRLICRHCQAEWRVRRVPGDNFYLSGSRPASARAWRMALTGPHSAGLGVMRW